MRKYIITLLIAAIFQAAIYFYLDRVVLVPAANFSQRTIKGEGGSSVAATYDGKLALPGDDYLGRILPPWGSPISKTFNLRRIP